MESTPQNHHDTGYKELFSHPEFVQQLLEGFAPPEISGLMDFSTLKNHSGNYITPLFEEKFEDVVWSVEVNWDGFRSASISKRAILMGNLDWFKLRLAAYLALKKPRKTIEGFSRRLTELSQLSRRTRTKTGSTKSLPGGLNDIYSGLALRLI